MRVLKWDKSHVQVLGREGYNCFQKFRMSTAFAAFDSFRIHDLNSCQAVLLFEMAYSVWASYRPKISFRLCIPCKIETK